MLRKLPCQFTLLLFFIFPFTVSAQWTNLNTGIDDNLTGAVFLGQNGMASGDAGLYFTTTGGSGAASWTRFEITDNAAASAVYENTSFTHCYSYVSSPTATSGFVFACGRDNATTKAVIFKISIPSMAYAIVYSGPVNSKLNMIDGYDDTYLAVGDDGLLVGFTNTTATTIANGILDDIVSVDVFQYKALLGTNQKMYSASYTGSSIGTMTQLVTPDTNPKDVSLISATGAYSLGTETFSYGFLTATPGPVTTVQNFYGPLNANGLAYINYQFYYATEHGIYKATPPASFANTAIEWQPSSLSQQVKDFWNISGNNTIYAFGNNGLILKTTNGGGATKPYVRITSEGNCYPGQTQMRAITGSANAYSWYVDGTLVQSGTNNFYYTFPGLGSYVITLTVQNSFAEQSTDTKTFYIVNPPQIDKTVTLSDNILCKQEQIQVEISDSEPNVSYMLKLEGQPNSNFGESAAGNGGLLSFTTNIIDVTGSYYIYAKSTLSGCGQRFTGNFTITVEETKADFHAGLINVAVNEPVKFSQNAVDAQNFEWQFSNGASPATSASATPTVTFNTLGPVTTTLHAWSNNDCHDTVTEQKSNVFQLPATQDDCLMLVNNSNDPQWPGYYNPDISQMVPTSDGFLICGTYFNEIFDSEYGIVKSMPGKKGGYLAKYDRNGVVRWVVYNLNTQFGNNNNNVVYSTAVDLDGNIYISGKGVGNFIDNTGNVTDLSATPNVPEYYLIKLNANGEKIWYLQNLSVPFARIAVDKENNVVVLSGLSNYITNVYTYFNGTLAPQIGLQVIPDAQYGIFKFSPAGSVVWETKVNLNSANARKLVDLGFDSANNIYFAAAFDGYATVYQPGATAISQTIDGDGSYGSKIGLFKLDENGNFIWKLRSRTVNSTGFPSDHTRAHAMIVEDDGTIYMTGQNSTGENVLGITNHIHQVESTDGSVVSTNKGEFFVAKIGSDGICQWLRAAGSTYYGWGAQLVKSGSEIYVVGEMRNNGPATCTGNFDSANGIGYDLTINQYDYFVAVYSDTGNLKRIFVNNEGTNAAYHEDMPGLFKGTGDYFYLAKNISPMGGGEIYHDFGMTTPMLNGTDGTVVRFTDECGIIKYEAQLGIDDIGSLVKLQLIPNPTHGNVIIDLTEFHETVSIMIYDIAGKVIAKQDFSHVDKVAMHIPGENGMYFVRLKTKNGEKMFKVVKN